MEGHVFAPFLSLLFWVIAYLGLTIWTIHTFTEDLLPKSLSQRFGRKGNIWFLILPVVIPAIAAGIIYLFGGMMDTNSIRWGCYIEDFQLYAMLLWLASLIIWAITFILGMIKPSNLGMKNRGNVVISVAINAVGSFFLILFFGLAIEFFSGPLPGKNLSCW